MGTTRSEPVRDVRIQRYVDRLGVAGMLGAVGLAASSHGLPAPLVVVALVLLAALGDVEFLAIRHGDAGNAFNCSEAVLVAALVFLGPWAPVVGTAGVLLHQSVAKRALLKRWFNASAYALSASVATLVFLGLGAAGLPAWATLAGAAGTYYVVNLGSVAHVISLATGESHGVILRRSGRLSAAVAGGNAWAAIVISLIAATNPAVLVMVPLVIAQLLLSHRNTRIVTSERDVWARLQEVSTDLIRVSPGEAVPTALEAAVDLLSASQAEAVVTTPTGATRWARLRDGGCERTDGTIAELAGPYWDLAQQRVAVAVSADGAAGLRASPVLRTTQDEDLVAPLEIGDELVGLLRVRTDRLVNDTARALSVLTNLAAQTAAALANERLVGELRHAAGHDALTELPNRTRMLDDLERALRTARRSGSQLSVLFFDLDRFKVINDSLGHHFGDRLLIAVADRLRGVTRAGDLVARFGGDEFILATTSTAPDAAQSLAERVVAALREPIVLDGRPTSLSVSVGLALDDGSGDANSLLRDADAAMYAAKAAGPGSVRSFTPDMRAAVLDRLELETELRAALDAREIDVAFQPIVDLATGAIVELEALARWTHARLGPISPATFIPVAEETGQIRRLGAVVLEQACRRLREWQDIGLGGPGLRVAVNVSAVQVDEMLPSIVADTLRRTGLAAECLSLEVTESALVAGSDAVQVLTALRHAGVGIALDDFGTGFSSLSTLRELPVETLKIDQSFIRRLGSDDDDAMVRGILGLAEALGLTVVAEGIETEDDARRLRAFGCDRGQGWHFGRPVRHPLVDAGAARGAQVVPIRGRRATA